MRTAVQSAPRSDGEPPAGEDLVTRTTITDSAPKGERAKATVTKTVVAVHGIGDQYSYATIQSVVNRFCSHFRYPAAVPLGSFHTSDGPFSLGAPYPDEPFRRFAFAEVYWATIPRTLANDRHTVEESKKWARTIVERLRLRRDAKGMRSEYSEGDFRLTNQVLAEMIQTIAVLDRIFFLADKAGLFTFDLRKLLDDYLGDVQVVTEFERHRAKILDAFTGVMDEVHRSYPDADIYVVAHSEGTVVSLLGLLRAFRQAPAPEWAKRVRGFMTLGSPIDKHLVLWPELFSQAAAPPDPPRDAPPRPIQWRNYFDFGDPVGFALNDARAWIRQNGWESVFEFTEAKGHDNGFSRYPFPGKAHVDYWEDDAVFGHFIQTVIGEPPRAPDGSPAVDYGAPPPNVRLSQLLSYVVPYVLVATLLVVAAYVLYKAVTDAMDPSGVTFGHSAVVARGVGGIAALLFGITAAARIPRLTRNAFWRATAIAGCVVAAGIYLWSMRGFDDTVLLGRSLPAGSLTLALAVLVIPMSWLRPAWGLRPLMLAGAAAVAAVTATYVRGAEGAVWPVVFAAAAFLYLWWLAALVFDLVFAWHVYIRHANVLRRMDEILGGRRSSQNDHTERQADALGGAPQVQR